MNNQQVEKSNLTNEINDLEPQHTEEIKGGQTSGHALPTKVGQASNTGVRGDFDGDGRSDIAVYQPQS